MVLTVGHEGSDAMYDVLVKHCNLGVDRRFVHWANKDKSVNGDRSFSTVEQVLVGYYNEKGQFFPPHMTDWKKGSLVCGEACNKLTTDIRDNLMVIPKLKQFFHAGDKKEVSKWFASVYFLDLLI